MTPAYRLFNREILTLQNYATTPIPGVRVIELARHVDESGSFTELLRFDAGRAQIAMEPSFEIKQLNWSELEPGVVRAFHIHKRQTDIWFVPSHEKVLVLLYDLRQWPEKAAFEPSEGNGQASKPLITQTQRVALGDGRSRLLVIPPYVAHGFRSLMEHKTRLLYAVDQQFSPAPELCDEWRLPWDFFGETVWDIENG